jgi:hypothetical protein
VTFREQLTPPATNSGPRALSAALNIADNLFRPSEKIGINDHARGHDVFVLIVPVCLRPRWQTRHFTREAPTPTRIERACNLLRWRAV